MSNINFLTTFLKDKNVGAVVKSSPYAVNKICSCIDSSRDLAVVEYGAGDGVITRALLAKLSPRSRLIAIETNGSFIEQLRAVRDPRLVVSHGRAEEVDNILQTNAIVRADYVVSGIPFTFIPFEARRTIIRKTRRALKPGGSFIVYQYSPAMARHLKYEFGNLNTRFIPFNLPSYFLMEARRADDEI